MVLSTCAALVLLIATVDAIYCPSFTGTRKGLLFLHWVLINYVTSISSTEWRCIPFDGIFGMLLPWSVVVLLADSEITSYKYQSADLSRWERILTVSLLTLYDLLCIVLTVMSSFMVNAVLVSLLLAGITFVFNQRQGVSYLRNEKELLSLNHDDLFYDPFDVFSGLGGFMNYCTITVCLIVKLFPELIYVDVLLYILFILRSIFTIQLLTMPAMIGGTIATMKHIGWSLADRKSGKLNGKLNGYKLEKGGV